MMTWKTPVINPTWYNSSEALRILIIIGLHFIINILWKPSQIGANFMHFAAVLSETGESVQIKSMVFLREAPYFCTWKVYNSKLIAIIEISRRGYISWGKTFSVKQTIISKTVFHISSYFVQRKKFLGEINIFRQENIRSFKLDLD